MGTTAGAGPRNARQSDERPLVRLYLVRHGRTALNAAGVLRGRLDPPIDEIGRRQASKLGIVLGRDQVTRIVASPLRRALETATAIGTECRREVVVDFRLVDRDYGIFAGRRQGAVEKAWGSIEGAPGVEPSGEVRGRAMAALADAARDATEGAVVVVSHDAVIRLCLVACDPSLGDPAGLAQGTGHFNVVEIRSGTWRVLDVNVRPPTTLPR